MRIGSQLQAQSESQDRPVQVKRGLRSNDAEKSNEACSIANGTRLGKVSFDRNTTESSAECRALHQEADPTLEVVRPEELQAASLEELRPVVSPEEESE